jgi:Ca2+-binding EF-hand superfamily protein
MFSQSEKDLKEIAFKIFDTNGDGRLSERDMFELMQ